MDGWVGKREKEGKEMKKRICHPALSIGHVMFAPFLSSKGRWSPLRRVLVQRHPSLPLLLSVSLFLLHSSTQLKADGVVNVDRTKLSIWRNTHSPCVFAHFHVHCVSFHFHFSSTC
ncbi:hypothetical protein I7I53_08187 [Histoplasma capsulatum var. duboisii H88]|uniref:Uncharacterized protein n=1 Tax=Ajellomyces capsulatus (strain H88) TaxID=544711 RepID=A0A8A1LF74_AJEC8|nr:hypothetical protein I7I53_08187 [Histoplasma capsulatum var. duboisii H88]